MKIHRCPHGNEENKKHKGIELKEFKSDKPVIFDTPKRMLVCNKAELLVDEYIDTVYAYIPGAEYPVKTGCNGFYRCAEIPEQPKPRWATDRELAKWLAQGNGDFRCVVENDGIRKIDFSYIEDMMPAMDCVVRKWNDKDWHKPSVEYLGLEY